MVIPSINELYLNKEMVLFTHKSHFVLYASPDKVFEALTDPGIIASWGGGMSVVGTEAGMPFEWFDGLISGEMLSVQPSKELSFTWRSAEWDKKAPSSQVTLHFHPHPAGTDLVLVHSEFYSEELMNQTALGWIDRVFEPLNDYFTEELSRGLSTESAPFA